MRLRDEARDAGRERDWDVFSDVLSFFDGCRLPKLALWSRPALGA
jgi:hypothetical protein